MSMWLGILVTTVHNLLVMTTAIQREFLGWERPLLETAVEWLFRRGGSAERSPLADASG